MTTSRRNFFATLFGGWLMAASGLKLDAAPVLPEKPLPLPTSSGSMWDEALPISEVEKHLFTAMKSITKEVMDKFYREHFQAIS